MLKPSLLLLLLAPLICFAQINISGKIASQDNKDPLDKTIVFFNNTKLSAITGADGTYIVKDVKPGQYTLTIFKFGYRAYSRVMLIDHSIELPDIFLEPIPKLLEVIKYVEDFIHARDLNDFTKAFLGSTENAEQCIILNPEVINLDYDPKARVLRGSSKDFIQIANKALGYLVKYKLDTFYYTAKGQVHFEGLTLFDDLKGTSAQIKTWQKNRREVYQGSSMHFFRAVIANQLDYEGFKVLKLTRKINPDYTLKNNKPKMLSILDKKTNLVIPDFISRTNQRGLFAMTFTDCLYIMYTKKHDYFNNNNLDLPPGAPSYPASTVTLTEPHAFFDNNGVITDPNSLIMEGMWGLSRIADLLPLDYEPVVQK
jgi:hypothetical protein